MHVRMIPPRAPVSSPQSLGNSSSASSGKNFQVAQPPPNLPRSFLQGAPAGIMPSLGSQTISTLLQLQAQEIEEQDEREETEDDGFSDLNGGARKQKRRTERHNL